MSLDEFIRKDQYNLEQVCALLPHFRELMPRIHELYERSRMFMPIVTDATSLLYARGFLLCHKGFMSAATTIGRLHPDDAGSITRRAIEVARMAIAVKYDPTNIERWRDEKTRAKRWEDRLKGEKPGFFKPDIKYPPGHKILDELRRYEGVLSDVFVHFTPEFVEGQRWRHEEEGEAHFMKMPFQFDQRSVERELLALGGIHLRILDLFDECFDRSFSRQVDWGRKRAEVVACGNALGELFKGPPPQIEGAEDTGQ